jgi:hypothetical protein
MRGMDPESSERVGVLVIRVWIEAGHQPRARITLSLDILGSASTTMVASSVDDVCLIVQEWLTSFLDQ